MKPMAIILSLVLSLSAHGDEVSWITDYIDHTPKFPKEAVKCYSYTRLLRDPLAFKKVIQQIADRYRDESIEAIIGMDSDGFIFASALAYELGKPLVLLRKDKRSKKGLNFEVERKEMIEDKNVLLVSDLIVNGRTIRAAVRCLNESKAKIHEIFCFLEVTERGGRKNFTDPIHALISY